MSSRTIQPNVECLISIRLIYELSDNQYFCKTKKAWEIWQKDPASGLDRRVHRIPAHRIFIVCEKE